MAPTIRASASSKGFFGSGAGGSMSVTVPAAAVTGDVVYAIFGWNTTSGTLKTLSGAIPSGWSQVGALRNNNTNNGSSAGTVGIFTTTVSASNPGGSTLTLNLAAATGDTGWNAIAVVVQDGSAIPASDNVAGNNNSNSSTTVSAWPGAGANANNLFLIVGQTTGQSATPSLTFTAPSPTVMVAQGSQASGSSYQSGLFVLTDPNRSAPYANVPTSMSVRGAVAGQLQIPPSTLALSGRASLSGTSTLTATGAAAIAASGRATLTGAATLSTSGFATALAAGRATLQGSATLAATGEGYVAPQLGGQGRIDGTAVLTAAGEAATDDGGPVVTPPGAGGGALETVRRSTFTRTMQVHGRADTISAAGSVHYLPGGTDA